MVTESTGEDEAVTLTIRMEGEWEDRNVDPEWRLVLGALNDGVITPAIAKAWMFGEDGASFRRLDGSWTHQVMPCGCQEYVSSSGSSGGIACCCLDEDGCDRRHEHKPEPWSRGTARLQSRGEERQPDFLDCLRAAGYEVPEPPEAEAPRLPF